MRILHVVRPASGGMRLHLMLLVRGLIRRGFETGIVSPSPEMAGFAAELGIPGVIAPIGDLPGPLDIAAGRKIRDAIRSLRPDIVHCHGLRAAWVGRPAARRYGRPTIVTYHATLDGGNLLFRAGTIALERIMAGWNALSIAVSRDVRRDIEIRLGLASHTVATILNGIELAPFRPQRSGDEIRKSLNLPAGAVVIGTVARLCPQKDLSTLFHAAKSVMAANRAVYLVVVGDGPLRRSLEGLAVRLGIADRLLMLGRREDVPALLGAMDIFALSSRYEGAPLALMEAMAAGLPVVATAVGGINDLIEEGRTGFRSPPQDPAALGDRLAEMAADRELRREIGERAREFAFKYLDAAKMVDETCRVYQSVLS